MRRGMISVVMLGSLLVLASGVLAQEKKLSGTLKLSEGSVAVGVGLSWGGGVLTYEGKDYPFSMQGLAVADVGISRAEATGMVYNLTQLADFDGNYTIRRSPPAPPWVEELVQPPYAIKMGS